MVLWLHFNSIKCTLMPEEPFNQIQTQILFGLSYYFLPLHYLGVTKVRRQTALDFNAIQSEIIDFRCKCGEMCQEALTPDEILVWRQKIHTLPQGQERMTLLMEIIRMTAMTLTRKQDTRFKVNDTTVCRYRFFSFYSFAKLPQKQTNLKKLYKFVLFLNIHQSFKQSAMNDRYSLSFLTKAPISLDCNN